MIFFFFRKEYFKQFIIIIPSPYLYFLLPIYQILYLSDLSFDIKINENINLLIIFILNFAVKLISLR